MSTAYIYLVCLWLILSEIYLIFLGIAFQTEMKNVSYKLLKDKND